MKNISVSEIVKPISVAVGAIITVGGLIGLIYGSKVYVENLVDTRLKNPEVIEKLARIIRPALIFDNKGAIIADLGGLEYVDSLKLIHSKDYVYVPVEIEVKCKKFLALPPLLTSIDQYSFTETVERGEGLTWVFKLTILSHSLKSSIQAPPPIYRFRLEILR